MWWGNKNCSNDPGHMTRITYDKKKHESFFFSGAKRLITLKLCMYSSTTKFVQMCWTWPILWEGQTVLYAFVWEKVKTMDYSETIVVYDIKVGRCCQLHKYMKLLVPMVKAIDWPWSKSLRFNIFKLLFRGVQIKFSCRKIQITCSKIETWIKWRKFASDFLPLSLVYRFGYRSHPVSKGIDFDLFIYANEIATLFWKTYWRKGRITFSGLDFNWQI